MSKFEKALEKILRGTADTSVEFEDLRFLLRDLGLQERIRGSHRIFSKSEIVEIINLQPNGAKAKPYQVKQVRNLILKYKLAGEQ